MYKHLKRLIIIDLCLLISAVIFWSATSNSNDFSGMIVVVPILGITVVTAAIMITIKTRYSNVLWALLISSLPFIFI